MSETAAVVAPALALLKAAGILAWRNNVDQRGRVKCGLGTGSADIVGILPGGRFFALECKTDKGKLSDEQQAWGNAVIRASGRWAVVRSAAEAIEWVMKWKEWDAAA